MIELVYPVGSIVPVLPAATSEHPTRKKKGERYEMFPVIQENGMVTAMADRAFCHSGSHLLHPVVHLHIIDRSERIFLQKRSAKKELQPGRWDTSVGGHVIYGESILEALFREASEELNLTGFNPIYLGSYRYDTSRDSEFVNMFAAVGSFNLVPDGDEVSEGRWWTVDEIEGNLSSGILTENFSSEFKMIKKQLLALL